MACWKIHRFLNLLMILLLKTSIDREFPSWPWSWWPDRIFLIQWTTQKTKASLGVPGQVTQIHLQGIAELGLQLSQGLLVAVVWMLVAGRHLPRNTSYLQWIWSGGLGPWALNFKRIFRNIFHSIPLIRVKWSVLTLGINRCLNHYPPPVRACHGRAMVLETAGCFLTGTVSFLDSQPLLSRGIFFFECLICYAISPGLVDKNHPISRNSSGYTLHTWHPLLFEASGCPSRSLASQVAEHGTCHVKRTHFMHSCWDLLLGMDSYIQ